MRTFTLCCLCCFGLLYTANAQSPTEYYYGSAGAEQALVDMRPLGDDRLLLLFGQQTGADGRMGLHLQVRALVDQSLVDSVTLTAAATQVHPVSIAHVGDLIYVVAQHSTDPSGSAWTGVPWLYRIDEELRLQSRHALTPTSQAPLSGADLLPLDGNRVAVALSERGAGRLWAGVYDRGRETLVWEHTYADRPSRITESLPKHYTFWVPYTNGDLLLATTLGDRIATYRFRADGTLLFGRPITSLTLVRTPFLADAVLLGDERVRLLGRFNNGPPVFRGYTMDGTGELIDQVHFDYPVTASGLSYLYLRRQPDGSYLAVAHIHHNHTLFLHLGADLTLLEESSTGTADLGGTPPRLATLTPSGHFCFVPPTTRPPLPGYNRTRLRWRTPAGFTGRVELEGPLAGRERGERLLALAGDTLLVAGTRFGRADDRDIWLLWVDGKGAVLHDTPLDSYLADSLLDLTVAPNGDLYALLGTPNRPNTQTLFRLDAGGEVRWEKTINGYYDTYPEHANRLLATATGRLYLGGGGGGSLIEVDVADGTQRPVHYHPDYVLTGLVENDDGALLLLLTTYSNRDEDLTVHRLDPEGTLLDSYVHRLSEVPFENFLPHSIRVERAGIRIFGEVSTFTNVIDGRFEDILLAMDGSALLRRTPVALPATTTWRKAWGTADEAILWSGAGLRRRFTATETAPQPLDTAPYRDAVYTASGTGWALGSRIHRGNYDIYLRRLDAEGPVQLEPRPFQPSFRLFPNPTAGGCYLQLQHPVASPVSVRLFDALGRPVWQRRFERETTALTQWLDFSGLAGGHYRCAVRTGTYQQVQTVVVLP